MKNNQTGFFWIVLIAVGLIFNVSCTSNINKNKETTQIVTPTSIGKDMKDNVNYLDNNSIDGYDKRKYYGFCYAAYRRGQSPKLGIFPTEEELKEDLEFISRFTKRIRTYGTSGTMAKVPELADQTGLECYMGVWLGKDNAENDKEVKNGIAVLKKNYKSLSGVIVGNEVILRGDLTVEKYKEYIQKIKRASNVPVGIADSYGKILEHPEIAEDLDFILVHIHPYWEGVSSKEAADDVLNKYNNVKNAFPGKNVMIGETGFPSEGNGNGSAIPSNKNQVEFFKKFISIADKNNIPYFFFDSSDEDWKEEEEDTPGAAWGIYTLEGELKKGFEGLFPEGFKRRPHVKSDTAQNTAATVPQADTSSKNTMPPVNSANHQGTAASTSTPKTVSNDNYFYIYKDRYNRENHFYPSGYMGDQGDILIDESCIDAPHSGKTCIKVTYTAKGKGPYSPADYGPPLKWSGVYWLQPANNWGKEEKYKSKGYDLSKYSCFKFWAKAEKPCEGEFKVGGIDNKYGDSLNPAAGITIELTESWKEYTIDLSGKNLKHIIGGFVFALNQDMTPDGCTFYLDDMRYETDKT